MTIGLRSCVVGQSQADHVFIGASASLGKTVHAQWTGVGYQDNLSTFEHEDAGTFRKFAVEANHGSYVDGSLPGIQSRDREIVARSQGSLVVIKVAGVNLGIGHHIGAMAVNQ